MSGAIQKVETVMALDTTEHARRMEAMRAVIKASICPKGISDDEFTLFLEQSKRSGLDPLLKQAFCVPRRQKVNRNGREEWIDKHEFQAAEAGMLARAERFPDYEGTTAAEVYAEDPISLDYGTGSVQHIVNPAKRKGALIGAWARVQRKGKVPVLVWVDFEAAKQGTPLWAKMPAVMVRKAARVAALRTAYPESFGGLYVAGERPDDMDGEEEAISGPVLSKPVMSATTATREAMPTLQRAEPEKVPLANVVDAETVPTREPGGDDGDEPEIWEAWVDEVKQVATREGFKNYAEKAKRLPEKTPGRIAMSKALKEADARLKSEGK